MEEQSLIPVAEFLAQARRRGVNLSLRALRLYYSPRYELLDPPVFKKGGGHIAYMPQGDVDLLEVVFKLNRGYGITLTQIKKLLDFVPDKYYPLIKAGCIPPVVFEKLLNAKFDQKIFSGMSKDKITDAHILACGESLIHWAKHGGAELLGQALNTAPTRG